MLQNDSPSSVETSTTCPTFLSEQSIGSVSFKMCKGLWRDICGTGVDTAASVAILSTTLGIPGTDDEVETGGKA